MKKIINVLCKITSFCIILIVLEMLTGMSGETEIFAAENNNPLLEGLSIAGPDYTYEYKEWVSFTLKKDGKQIDNNEEMQYKKLHYTWSSANENVANFVMTNDSYFSGCLGMPYPVLDRPNVFRIKSGTTVIYCTISDDDGNKMVLSKNLTVIKETPMKELKFGNNKLVKEDVNADDGVIYTNEIAKNVKIEPVLEDGWELISENSISIDTNDDYNINVVVENKNRQLKFCYVLRIQRYVLHQIDLKNLKNECAFVRRVKGMPPVPCYHSQTIIYDVNSSETDSDTFKDGNDLVRKFIAYYHYDRYCVEYKNGIFCYKETRGSGPWTYCTTKEERIKAEKEANIQDDRLLGLSIVGPDYVYGIENIAKFHLEKNLLTGFDEEKDNMMKNYDDLSCWWSSNNGKVAKFQKSLNKKNLYASSRRVSLKQTVVFRIKAGTVVIRCNIRNSQNESVVLQKTVKVLKGCPIKNLKIGAYKLKKVERNVKKNKKMIYSKKKKVKLKISLAKGWCVKCVQVRNGKTVKDITKKKTFYIKSKRVRKIQIVLKNKKRGQTFTYECKVKRE